MAARSEKPIAPPTEPEYPKCPICGWWDRKLRLVGSSLLPEERLMVHAWARHGAPFPFQLIPPKKDEGPESS